VRNQGGVDHERLLEKDLWRRDNAVMSSCLFR
jgi:hypothetical protein